MLEFSSSGSLRKGGMPLYGEMSLAKNTEVSILQDHKQTPSSNKYLDATNDKNDTDRDNKVVESILLNSTRSPRKSNFVVAIKSQEASTKASPQKLEQPSIDKDSQPQPNDSEQQQPKKLFQRKDAPANGRSPMLFAKKPSPTFSKPSGFNGQTGMVKIGLPPSVVKTEEANLDIQIKEKDKKEEAIINEQPNQTSSVNATKKTNLKKDHFHGVSLY